MILARVTFSNVQADAVHQNHIHFRLGEQDNNMQNLHWAAVGMLPLWSVAMEWV